MEEKQIEHLEVLFANKNDEDELREILWEYGMDIAGDIEDHVVLKDKEKVLAGGKIIEHEKGCFFLEVIGVREENRIHGLGGALLGSIVKNPWNYCKNLISEPINQKNFSISTVARGEAKGFYEKYGYVPCSFQEIPVPYREQCVDCPDREDCGPVPMILNSEVAQ